MIAAFAVLIVLAGTAANLHYFGTVADSQRHEQATLDTERARLGNWAARLVLRDLQHVARSHGTPYDQAADTRHIDEAAE